MTQRQAKATEAAIKALQAADEKAAEARRAAEQALRAKHIEEMLADVRASCAKMTADLDALTSEIRGG